MARDSLRLFLAILVGDDARRRLQRLCSDLAPELRGFRWTKPDQLHLTLAFLGDVDSDRLDDLTTAVNAAASSCPRIDIEWRKLGAFPKASRANVLWAGVGQGAAAATKLHKTVADALTYAGFQIDERFTPHVTLARYKRFGRAPDLGDLLERGRHLDFGVHRVSDVVVMKSVCLQSGSVYTPLATIPLGGEYNECDSQG